MLFVCTSIIMFFGFLFWTAGRLNDKVEQQN